jgi:sugar phosphate isomerase/epimerase
VCDACHDLKVSIEYKPTDEVSRFALVGSTGAALLLVQEVGRPNMGLTLDVGHMLMAGENPAQSIELASRTGRLFGVQLGDGHSRLGAEDGLMFASVHGLMALEVVFWLQRSGYEGYIYFDTFPLNENPVQVDRLAAIPSF